MPRKIIKEEFIKKAQKIHGKDKYNYDKVEYIKASKKVQIYCNTCKEYFWQFPSNHYRYGCKKCAIRKQIKRQSLDTNQFIERAQKVHGKDEYNYDKVKYINNRTKVQIFCNKCKKYFYQNPNSHLLGCGCSKCKGGVVYDNEKFIEKAQKIQGKETYDYSKVNYINDVTPVIIHCNICNNDFYQTPHNHYRLYGCSYCSPKSKGEYKISKWLNNNKLKFYQQYWFKDCRDKNPLPFDFYLPDYNLCIEYQGEQHYKMVCFQRTEEKFQKQQYHDQLKRDYCNNNNNNILLIEIKYDDNIEEKLKDIFIK